MYGHSTVSALTDVQEAAHDDITGGGAIHEEEVVVVQASVREALGVVDLLVQPDHRGYVVLAEVGKVGLWSVERVAWERGRREEGNHTLMSERSQPDVLNALDRENPSQRAEPVPQRAEPVPKRAEPVPQRAEPVPKRAEPVPQKAAAVSQCLFT